MRKTKIVCTIGPATNSEQAIKKLVIAGMNVVRVNMSHGTNEEHIQTIKRIIKIREDLGTSLGIMVDLKGPEVRIKSFENNKVVLKSGQQFVLDAKTQPGNSNRVAVTTTQLFESMQKGQKLLLSDGSIELVVQSVCKNSAVCKVKTGGVLSNNKSINAPGLKLNLPFLSSTDKRDILMAISEDVEFIALSFVQSKKDVESARKFLNRNGGESIKIIAKIENQSGVKNMAEIIDAADGVMVARGDLAVDVDFVRLPHIQNKMLELAQKKHKFAITATQMLVSMVNASRPTRAEVTDVANAVLLGSGAVMLSEETAIGKHPALCVKTMAKIVLECEKHLGKKVKDLQKTKSELESVCFGAISAAENAKIKNIVVVTGSGKTALELACYRPIANVIALTPHEQTLNQMSIVYGVNAYNIPVVSTTTKLWTESREILVNQKLVKPNEKIIYISGEPQNQKNNLFEIKQI